MLPEATPLLSKGTDRYAERTLSGQIAEGVDGTLALYTYETESTDSKGNRQIQYHRFTVGLVEVPECAQHVPELYCQQKFGLHALEKFEDVFRRSKERVKLESEVLDEKYEIFSGKGQDANWLRQLFSPTFIVWLTDEAPKKFAFELVDGTLCCYIHGHEDDAAGLDMVSAAAGHGRPAPARGVRRVEAGRGLEPAEQDVGVGDQAGGDHQQDRGDEDEGDDELDLGRGAGGALLDGAALVAAQGARLAAQLVGQRASRSGASARSTSRGWRPRCRAPVRAGSPAPPTAAGRTRSRRP